MAAHVAPDAPALDLVDDTFVVAPVGELRDVLCDESAWSRHGLTVVCREDRGDLGRRWDLDGRLTGTAEVWLEQAHGGVVVHLFVQADSAQGRRVSRRRLERRYARPLRAWILQVKAGYDRQRPAGRAGRVEPPAARTSMGATARPSPDQEG